MPEHRWINDGDDPAVVLATLADLYLEAQERTHTHGGVRGAASVMTIELKRRHLVEALDEFYALHPYLASLRRKAQAST